MARLSESNKKSAQTPVDCPRVGIALKAVYPNRGVAERQTRGAQNAVGSARAGSNPAAPTMSYTTSPRGRAFRALNAKRHAR